MKLNILSEALNIEAKDSNNIKYYPVFIVLSYTGTIFSKLIRYFTNDTYGHASISFDSNMDKMLSFNRDGDGLTQENLKDFAKDDKKDVAKYSIFVYMANEEEYSLMREYVKDIKSKISSLKYNLLGALRLIPNQHIFGKESEVEDKFFCSEFVASVLNVANKKILNRASYLIRPSMFTKIKKFNFIKRGFIKNFNPKEIDEILREKLSEKYKSVTIE